MAVTQQEISNLQAQITALKQRLTRAEATIQILEGQLAKVRKG